MRFHVPEHKKLTHQTAAPIRWGDMDSMGHVNNTLCFRHFETVRIDWLCLVGGMHHLNEPGPVIVNPCCSFLRRLEYPAEMLAQPVELTEGMAPPDTTLRHVAASCHARYTRCRHTAFEGNLARRNRAPATRLGGGPCLRPA